MLDKAVRILVIWGEKEGLEDAVTVEGGRGTEGEGELLAVEAMEEDKAEKVGVGKTNKAEASNCACFARFLAAALVCQPHEHGLLGEGMKKF